MFFKVILRNSRKNRRDNSILFGSMIAAVVLFYIILSMENQDVMQFLKMMESDAVSRLLGMVPLLYGFSLFLIFFLVYFAGSYQMECRSREFGVWLMLGMKRKKLLAVLMAEDMWNSFLAVIIGLPAAVFLSEVISLVISRVAGLGIIGHHSAFSVKAVVWTLIGFFGVKFLAFLILSGQTVRREICLLMKEGQEEKQKIIKEKRSLGRFLSGMVLLIAAYVTAIAGIAWRNILTMGGTVIVGTAGTFLMFSGMGKWLEVSAKRGKRRSLFTFTYRQLQENVFLKHKSMAVSSLLILMALVSFAYGIGIGWLTKGEEGHTVDFTFTGQESEIRKELASTKFDGVFGDLSEVKVKLLFAEEGFDDEEISGTVHEFQAGELEEAARKLPASEEKETILNNLQYFTSPYVISLSGYNEVRKLAKKDEIRLENNEIALYADADFSDDKYKEALEQACRANPSFVIDGSTYKVTGTLYIDNFVADRLITVDLGLIVSDEVFGRLFAGEEISSYWNTVVQEELVEKEGLLRAIMQVNNQLKETGLEYETYLQGLGRQMFYNVSSTYISLYLAVIFLIIANTVISVQFLMQQKKNGRRYRTLIMLGSDYQSVCRSSDTQIKWYFFLTVAAAVISSVFGVGSLFAGVLPSGLTDRLPVLTVVALLMLVLLCVIEYIYIIMVIKLSRRNILEMIRPDIGKGGLGAVR